MNRKEFFKKLGLGALVVAVAPKVLEPQDESHLFTYSRGDGRALSYKDAQLIADEDLKMGMWCPHYFPELVKRYGEIDIQWLNYQIAFQKAKLL